jgi:nucleoside-diphosphate-sugar epimerase
MSHLLVLGDGWVGRATAKAAESSYEVSVIDPPLHPVLCNRDNRAVDTLRELLAQNATTTVINACGRLRGTEAELAEANTEFVQWLCTALAGTGVRLIHVGSAAEYGDPHTADLVSERSPQRAVGPYAQSKASGTEAVLRARGDGLDACVVRVFNIVGYPIPAASPIHQWLTDLQALGHSGGSIDVWWPPTTRDFVMIEDVARALVDIAATIELPALLNLCSGTGLSYGAIAESIAAELGSAATVNSLNRPGIETVVGDPALLEQTIGWVPTMTLNALAVRVVRGESASPSGGGSPANR